MAHAPPTRPKSPRDDTPITLHGKVLTADEINSITETKVDPPKVSRPGSPVFRAPPAEVFEFTPTVSNEPVGNTANLIPNPQDFPVIAPSPQMSQIPFLRSEPTPSYPSSLERPPFTGTTSPPPLVSERHQGPVYGVSERHQGPVYGVSPPPTAINSYSPMVNNGESPFVNNGQSPMGNNGPFNGYQQSPNGYQQLPNGYQQSPNGYQEQNGYQQSPNGYQQSLPSGGDDPPPLFNPATQFNPQLYGAEFVELYAKYPQYGNMAIPEQKRYRDVFRIKWDLLRSANPDITIPPFDEQEDLTLTHMRYDHQVQRIWAEGQKDEMRDMAVYFWGFMELVAVQFLGIQKAHGYMNFSIGQMKRFERVLIELGESYHSPGAKLSDIGVSGWLDGYSPMTKMILMSLFNMIIFLMVNYGISKITEKPEKAAILQEKIFSVISKVGENTRSRLGENANLVANVVNAMGPGGGGIFQALSRAFLLPRGGNAPAGNAPAAPNPVPAQAQGEEVLHQPAYVEE